MAGQPISLAEKILIARLRLREEQPDFGARFNVKRWMVNQWEKGKVEPKTEHRIKLRQIFRELFGDDEVQEEIHGHQLFLPFDQPVNFEFRVSPHAEDSVRFAVQIKRKAG